MGAEGSVLVVTDDPSIRAAVREGLGEGWTIQVLTEVNETRRAVDPSIDVLIVAGDDPPIPSDIAPRGPVLLIGTGSSGEWDWRISEQLPAGASSGVIGRTVERLQARGQFLENSRALYGALRTRELGRTTDGGGLERADLDIEAEVETLRQSTEELSHELDHGDYRALFNAIDDGDPD